MAWRCDNGLGHSDTEDSKSQLSRAMHYYAVKVTIGASDILMYFLRCMKGTETWYSMSLP